MARIRSAKPDFWTDPLISSLPRLVRWTFKGLWEVCADDEGRFLADARVIKGQLWPLDDDISAKKIESFLATLADKQRILLYVVSGVRYGVVVHFLKHQKISHPTKSKLPDPPDNPNDGGGNGSRVSPEGPRSDSGAPPERFRPDRDVDLDRDVDVDVEKDGIGVGGERAAFARNDARARGAADRPAADSADAELQLPLPDAALELLARMPADRRADGRQQFVAALHAPEGAKIKRDKYVRAQSPAHLAHACRRVIKQLPNARDKGSVALWVLQKLLDPWVETDANGRTLTEAAAHNERRQEAEPAIDQRQRIADGEEWAAAHPDEWAAIEARHQADYPGWEDNPVMQIALTIALRSAKCRAAESALAATPHGTSAGADAR